MNSRTDSEGDGPEIRAPQMEIGFETVVEGGRKACKRVSIFGLRQIHQSEKKF
jgi:hypothetical protein